MSEFSERPKAAVTPPNKNEFCIKCGKKLQKLDVALHKKMIHRYAQEYMCIDCLSKYIGVTKDALLEKAEYFKKQGCSFFR